MTSNIPVTAQEAEKPSCLSVALDYIEAGINCTPNHGPNAKGKNISDPGKQPKLTAWQSRRLTQDQAIRKFEDSDNLGIVTGKSSGIICLDCDKRSGGMDWFKANKDSLGTYITETTPGGGLHLYYKYPEDREKIESTKGLFQGVDFLADGTQVITWPSIHHSGGQYLIENGLTLVDALFETDAPPAWIIDIADAAAAKRASVTSTNTKCAPDAKWDKPSEIERAREALRHFPAAIQGQGGDMTTLKAAYRCRDFLLSPQTSLKLLKEIYNPRCIPPWEDRDLVRKIKHAFKYAKMEAGSSTIDATFSDPIPQEILTAIDAVEEEKALKGKYLLAKPIQCARRYIKKYAGRVLCDQGQLYSYNAQKFCWEMVDDDLFESILLRDINSESPALAEKTKIDQLRTFRIGVKRELEGLYKGMKPDSWLTASSGEFISLANGILDIATGALEPHSPDWFSFTTLPFPYDRNASCPDFMRFLDSVWDDDLELKRALQLWMGYILISPMNDQKFAILIGESRGGKSTLARVMESMIGKSNTIGCDIMQFGSDFGLEPVIGKKLAVFSEVDKSAGKEVLIATERIKRITGKDPITVNRKNKGMVDTFFTTKIVIICNAVPPFINSNNSLTNRMIAFPFTKTFQGREDRNLDAKLEAELPGIFNWALEGARALLGGERLLQAEAGARKIEEIAEVLDNVKGYISDAVKFSDELHAFVSCKVLFESYKTWCKESNYLPHGKKRFFQEFKGKTGNKVTAGIRKEAVGTVRGYFGLKLDQEFLAGHEFSTVEDEENDPIPF
jgi:putative DNA primase/helicase